MRLLAFTLLVLIAGILLIEKHAPPKTGVGGDGPQSARTLGSVYAAPTQVKLVDLIPASLSGETNQDSEPFLAIQTANPQVMVASAFTPNPFSNTGNAPVYVSQDGGKSWVLNAITPVQRMTCDITHAMAAGENHPRGDLHAGTLACASGITLDESESVDVSSSATMNVQSTRGNVDQPFVRALGVSSGDRIYVGVNDFNRANGQTATVDVSVDGGATYRSIPIEARKTAGQDGPSVRPALASDGTVYAAFFGWRKFDGKTATSDVVVVRDDAAATGTNPFRALKDPSDKLPGRVVVKNVAIPWSNAPALGQERIGSTLSIAVDPNRSAIVYVTWSKTDLPGATIHNATNVSLAIANNGVVGFLYQQLSARRWVTHLVQSHDGFTTARDVVLATVPADQPVGQFLPYLGDYDYLLAVGNEFRGVFCANNTPDFANFPQGVTFQRAADFSAKTLNDGAGNLVPISIDPFYFSVPVMP